ncbi:MAG: ferredoxin [Candidatus Marinimicrobia bacterium]|nr:ferredoxin [Candidatus Neomarinimicrobiota bacterium]
MIKVNEETCMGCALCVRVCPSGFEMVGNIAKVKDQEANCMEEAIEVCPVDAIYKENSEAAEIHKNSNIGTRINTGKSRPGRGLGKGSRSKGSGMGNGPGGYCICSSCDYQIPHQPGVPCYEQKCPKCNISMIRQ